MKHNKIVNANMRVYKVCEMFDEFFNESPNMIEAWE